jgi:hypothetical protein
MDICNECYGKLADLEICEGCQRVTKDISVTVEKYRLCPSCYEDYCQDIRFKYGENEFKLED